MVKRIPSGPTARIGFISSSPPSNAHHASFKALVPSGIEMTFVQAGRSGASIWDARGTVEALIDHVARLIDERHWNGVIVSGGPREVLNQRFYERLSADLKVAVATALRSSAVALQVLGVKRALLMTPVDDQLKNLYRDYLASFGIVAVYSPQTLRAHTDAQKLSGAEVEAMTLKSCGEHHGVDGIYFQGALLDPLQVLDKMEKNLGVPIVASNPAMLWFMASKLGLRYEIPGYGTLLRVWPDLPQV
jgi:maleate isomerase